MENKSFTVIWSIDLDARKKTAVVARMLGEKEIELLESKYESPKYAVEDFGDDPGGIVEGKTYQFGYDPMDWEV